MYCCNCDKIMPVAEARRRYDMRWTAGILITVLGSGMLATSLAYVYRSDAFLVIAAVTVFPAIILAFELSSRPDWSNCYACRVCDHRLQRKHPQPSPERYARQSEPTTVSSSAVTCPAANCGHVNRCNASYCGECGRPLRGQ